jgi:hypothetical protein
LGKKSAALEHQLIEIRHKRGRFLNFIDFEEEIINNF